MTDLQGEIDSRVPPCGAARPTAKASTSRRRFQSLELSVVRAEALRTRTITSDLNFSRYTRTAPDRASSAIDDRRCELQASCVGDEQTASDSPIRRDQQPVAQSGDGAPPFPPAEFNFHYDAINDVERLPALVMILSKTNSSRFRNPWHARG